MLSFPVVITHSEYLYYPTPSWGPNSNELMVAIPPEDGPAPPENFVYPETELWTLSLDGSAPVLAGAVESVWFLQQSGTAEGGMSELYLLNVETGESQFSDTPTGFYVLFDSAIP